MTEQSNEPDYPISDKLYVQFDGMYIWVVSKAHDQQVALGFQELRRLIEYARSKGLAV